jgi:cytoskeletal protein CcmA (bactofilin family)
VGVFSKSESERQDKGLNGSSGDGRPEAKAASGKTAPETVSTIGAGVLVTGNIVSGGTLQISGCVNGDIHASQLIINETAQVEGNVIAQEMTILGLCKGVIHGNSVKLQGMAVVEGEIYSKSLTIEQEARFEGVSRRRDKPVEAPSGAQTTMAAKIPLASAIRETAPAAVAAETIVA